MTRWLWIEASPRGPRSRSSALARAFLDAAGIQPTHLNVWDADLPAYDGAAVEARYSVLQGEAEAAQVESWKGVRSLFDHVHAHDAYVLSTPMWNWGVPYRLKQLIDLVTQPGLAFTATASGVTGHFSAKRAVVLTTSALTYAGDTARLDHQDRYLADWLDFIGLTDRTHIAAAPMYGPAEAVEAAFQAALHSATALARRF